MPLLCQLAVQTLMVALLLGIWSLLLLLEFRNILL